MIGIRARRLSWGMGAFYGMAVLCLCAPQAGAVTLVVTGANQTQAAMILSPGGPYTGHDNWGGRNFANIYPAFIMSNEAHALLRFDLPAIPPGERVASATLTLTRDGYLSSEGQVSLYRLLESWTEGTGSGSPTVYASETGGAGGTGFGPQDGSVDWFDREHGQTIWSSPGALGGASSLATPSAQHTVLGETTFTMDVTGDVSYWYENDPDLTNDGWVLTCADTDGQWRVGLRLRADDSSYGQPTLTIQTAPVPEPMTMGTLLFAVAGLSAYAMKRRRGERQPILAPT